MKAGWQGMLYWPAVLVGGGMGWWAMLGPGGWWMNMGLQVVSVLLFLATFRQTGVLTDAWLEKWVGRHGYLPCHRERQEKDKAAKWILCPFFVWWAPTMISLISGAAARVAF